MIVSKYKANSIIRSPQLLSAPVLAIGFCWLLTKYLPKEQMSMQPLFVVNTGLTFSVAMGGIMLTALPLSADKESNILRVLMVSSISPVVYLLGSILPSLGIIFVTNTLIGSLWLPEQIPLMSYIFISTVATLISLTLGLIIGLFCSNQVEASSTCIPVVFIFALLPILKVMSSDFEKYNKYLYTSQMLSYLERIYSNQSTVTTEMIIVFSSTFLFSVTLCIYGYIKNKFD